MPETDNSPELPRVKRKYTKRAKMLLRSNNDYIDHTYWPKVYAQSKKHHERMIKKHGVNARDTKAHIWNEQERKALTDMGINKRHVIIDIPDTPLTRIPITDK